MCGKVHPLHVKLMIQIQMSALKCEGGHDCSKLSAGGYERSLGIPGPSTSLSLAGVGELVQTAELRFYL